MGSKILTFILVLFSASVFAQSGVAIRKSDSTLLYNDNGKLILFKTQIYYKSLFATKLSYADTLDKVATKNSLNGLSNLYEPKFTTLPVNKGGTGQVSFTSNVLVKGNSSGALQSAVPGVDYISSADLNNYTSSLNATDMTSTAYTKNALNTAYPNVPVRFKVVCPNLGMVYEKYLNNQWFTINVTTLP